MTEWKDGKPDEYGFDRYGPSPYYDPKDHGLEILVEYDWAGDYEFDMVVVWRHVETGELRAAADSGCSCPVPFGDLTWDGMRPIREVADLAPLVENDYPALTIDSQDEGVAKLKAAVHRALRSAPAGEESK